MEWDSLLDEPAGESMPQGVVVTVPECANSHQFSLPFQGLVGPAKAFSIRLPFIGIRSEIGVWPDAVFVRCAVADPDTFFDSFLFL